MKEGEMEVVYSRCCGLDVHKASVVACVLRSDSGGVDRQVRTFGTMTADLLELSDWLAELEVTHVVLESTGVYWQPIWNLLEDRFALLLVNARHVKQVPGRKTDVKDSEWLAQLLRHGLLQASFVPDRPQRELRELTRYRTALVQERAAAVQRLQKTLEGANLKLASVATDITGVSGRAILEALADGQTDAAALADLARGRLKHKREALEQALVGRVGPHQRFMLAEHLRRLREHDAAIERVSAEIAERQRPFAEARARLESIPGVGPRVAEILLAEIGPELTRFPTAGHLASWAGMCPGNHQSAGKRFSGATRKANRWLRSALIEAAQAAGRTKETYLGTQYRRLAARRGAKKAAVAVGHSILVIVYYLLTRQRSYEELGTDYLAERERAARERKLARDAHLLGYRLVPGKPAA
jgi:transposase